jgi:Xaa-Pro dipeptidase
MTHEDSAIVIGEEQPNPGEPLSLTIADPIARRRATIEARLGQVTEILAEMQCEAVVFILPQHISWLCGGLNLRGLFADTERPGIYTNGKQRWILCSNLDSQRLFDEELDRLGFQLKEWQWATGRAALLGELTNGKKVACDRPFPNMPLINEKLRSVVRPLSDYDLSVYRKLGRGVAHALEATARNAEPLDTEQELAGHIAHRLMRHGIEPSAVTVSGAQHNAKYPRPGVTKDVPQGVVRLQATGSWDGFYVTCSRSFCVGLPTAQERQDHDFACKLSAAYRSYLMPEETFATVAEAGKRLTFNTDYEFDSRLTPLGYGTGRVNAEELRRMGQDERFQVNQPLITQARAGSALIVDTVVVQSPLMGVTPTSDWPFKRIRIGDKAFDVPELLVRKDSDYSS